MSLLQLRDIAIERAGHVLLRGLNLEVEPGQVVGVLGRNGVGKTTLLHAIMALHPLMSGNLLLNGEALHALDRVTLARSVGLLFQESPPDMPATVLETVLLGRHPHRNGYWESRRDQDMAIQALTDMGISHLAHRQMGQLSGGEKQRVALALLLAQAPLLYLLDEPGNHLDIAFQMHLLRFLRHRAAGDGCAIVMATHDINLAAGFCDTVVLLLGDGRHLVGSSKAILTTDNLAAAFDCDFLMISQAGRDFFHPA
ncbi:MAG: hypothetical protein RLZZ385_907 [Pseudomonadota bacterium]|jgi:iron complex transport system ATP-binding protein